MKVPETLRTQETPNMKSLTMMNTWDKQPHKKNLPTVHRKIKAITPSTQFTVSSCATPNGPKTPIQRLTEL